MRAEAAAVGLDGWWNGGALSTAGPAVPAPGRRAAAPHHSALARAARKPRETHSDPAPRKERRSAPAFPFPAVSRGAAGSQPGNGARSPHRRRLLVTAASARLPLRPGAEGLRRSPAPLAGPPPGPESARVPAGHVANIGPPSSGSGARLPVLSVSEAAAQECGTCSTPSLPFGPAGSWDAGACARLASSQPLVMAGFLRAPRRVLRVSFLHGACAKGKTQKSHRRVVRESRICKSSRCWGFLVRVRVQEAVCSAESQAVCCCRPSVTTDEQRQCFTGADRQWCVCVGRQSLLKLQKV